MKAKILTITTICIVSVFLMAGCEAREPDQQQTQSQASANHDHSGHDHGKLMNAADFTLKDYDGKEYSLSDYNDQIVVLEWFNYECPFCRHHYETTSDMVNLAAKYKEKGVAWLAINSTSHQETVKNKTYAQDHNIFFPILDDRDGTVGKKYGATRTPEMFVIKHGKILYHGAIDNAPLGKVEGGGEKINYVENALDEILAGKEVSTPKTKPYGCTVKYAK